MPKFNCIDCQSCYDDDVSECCGCVSLDYTWPGMRDMPPCDINVCEPLSGTWLDNSFNSKREEDLFELESELLNDSLVDDGQTLSPRQPPTANMSKKWIRVCGTSFGLKTPYMYPSFPEAHNKQWEGIQQGKWDAISRYWGNTLWICQSWAVGKVQPADVTYIPNNLGGYTPIRSLYQSTYMLRLLPYETRLADICFLQPSTFLRGSSSATSLPFGWTRAG